MKKIILFMAGASFCMNGWASVNAWDAYIQGGLAWPHFPGSTQDIDVGYGIINQYVVSAPTQSSGLFGLGVGYQRYFPHDIALHVGLTAEEMQSAVSGVNEPFIDGGTLGAVFDTLNFNVSAQSYALMVEPKIIWDHYAWQPYVLGGIGVAFNKLYGYSETPTDPAGSAVPTSTPFTGATNTNFAYEVGVGVQRRFSIKKYVPTLALDYRYLNWGATGLSTYTGQPTTGTLSFGNVTASSINLSLIWPFR